MEKSWYRFWHPFVPKNFQVEKPVTQYIREWANLCPERIALRFYGQNISYRELNEASDRFANGLTNLGLKKGERVGLLMQNCPQFIISFIGTLRAGGVVVSFNPMFKKDELEYEINDAGVEILVAFDYLYPEVLKIEGGLSLKRVILTSLQDYLPENPVLPLPYEARAPKREFPDTLDFQDILKNSSDTPICLIENMEEELALLQYTGGTTGTPKGAMISHYNLAFATVASGYWWHLREDDVSLGVAPFFHVMGMVVTMCAPLITGGQVVVLSRFIPEATAMAIAYYRCTFWTAATTMFIALLQLPNISEYDFSSFRLLISGGAPISVEIQNKVKVMAPKAFLGEGYGLSESTSAGGIVSPLYAYKPGFVGIPQYSDVKIMELENGNEEMPPHTVGEIVIKGPTIMKGYWQKPAETAQVLKDGWLYTGDLGLMDEDGYVQVVGRKKEMIICSGFNVFPAELEGILYKHPAIAEAAVIGIPDEYRGESPKAFIVLQSHAKGQTTEAEILSWCKDRMAAYKQPRKVEFCESLPKSGAGKLLKRLLVKDEKDS
jgi:acyl-CoA synthetase (AMP-forming)/AMP-acid ligase II